MIPSAAPIKLRSTIEHEPHGGVLIRRVLKRSGLPEGPVSAVVEVDDPESTALRTAFIDAAGGRPAIVRSIATVFHVLWCQIEASAFVRVGINDEGGLVRRPITPGDTVYVPPFIPFEIGPGILGYEICAYATMSEASPAADIHAQPVPVHGLDRFEGYNRCTICAASPDLVLERWKVTRPFPLKSSERRWRIVTNLVDPMAIVWHGGSDLIGRAESRLLSSDLDACTFIPDGLGYLLISYVPDLLADVVTPLQKAGHSETAIAALGSLGSGLTQAARANEADDPRESPQPPKASARPTPDAPGTSGTGI